MTPSVEEIIESIQQLPAREQEKVRRWLEARGASRYEEETSYAGAGRSAKSLRWMDEHRKEYSGRWVALDGDCLISSGQTAQEVYFKAKVAGVKIPFVELVTEDEPFPFCGGWLP